MDPPTHDDAHGQPDARPQVPSKPGTIAKLTSTEAGHQVWRPLRDLWLTNAVIAHHGTSQNAAYSWDAQAYAPVLALDGEDQPSLFFAKTGA